MKVKEIVLREADSTPIQGTIKTSKPSATKPGMQDVEVQTPTGMVQTTIDPNNPAQVSKAATGNDIKIAMPGQQVNNLASGQNVTLDYQQQQPGTTPAPTTTPQTPQTNTPVSEFSDEEDNEPVDYNIVNNNELIDLAKHAGIEDSLELDDDGVLLNRDEIIDLLQNGKDIGGDPTDELVNDIEDNEFGKILERMKGLAGL
jgi:hypothetical protein